MQWFTNEFTYAWEGPDRWQTVDETIDSKMGDCEDFAILSQALLKERGVGSELIIVKFEGMNISHVVCVWKEKEHYSFMSNRKLIRTSSNSIEDAVEEIYPDWGKIIFTNAKKQFKRIIRKKNSSAA